MRTSTGTTRAAAWHRTYSQHRCCRCERVIGQGQRYWGSGQEPGRIVCYWCKTGQARPSEQAEGVLV